MKQHLPEWMHRYCQKRYAIPTAIAVISISLFLLLALSPLLKKQTTLTTEKSWRINAVTIKKGRYRPDLILHGSTESPHRAVLEATITANVIATLVYEGDTVAKNAVIIQLDDREIQLIVNERAAEVAAFKAAIAAEFNKFKSDKNALDHEKELVNIAKKDVRRQTILWEKKLGSEAALDEARRKLQERALTLTTRQLSVDDHTNRLRELQAKLARTQALLSQAQLDLSRTQVRSPFTGRIAKLHVSVGNRVQPGESLVEIYDVNQIEVRAQIPALYVNTIADALTNRITLDATATLDGQEVTLQLDRLAGAVTQGSGGVAGLLKVITAKGYLALGRTLEIHLKLPFENNLYALPTQAIYGRNRVYRIQKQRLQSLFIERVGLLKSANGTLILARSAQLHDGDRIMATQLANARDGLKVTVIE